MKRSHGQSVCDEERDFQLLKELYQRPRHGWFTNPGSNDDQCASGASGVVRKSAYVTPQMLVVIGLFP